MRAVLPLAASEIGPPAVAKDGQPHDAQCALTTVNPSTMILLTARDRRPPEIYATILSTGLRTQVQALRVMTPLVVAAAEAARFLADP